MIEVGCGSFFVEDFVAYNALSVGKGDDLC